MHHKISACAKRYDNNYYIGLTNDELFSALPEYLRPIDSPLTTEIWRQIIYQKTMKYDAALHMVLNMNTHWAKCFRRKLNGGASEKHFSSLCVLKQQAFMLCTEYACQEFVFDMEERARIIISFARMPSIIKELSRGPLVSQKKDTLMVRRERPQERLREALDSMEELFMSLVGKPLLDQVHMWLERYHQNFYLNVTPSMLTQVQLPTRPLTVVTQEVYDKLVSRILLESFVKLDTIFRTKNCPFCQAFVRSVGHCKDSTMDHVLATSDQCWIIMRSYQATHNANNCTGLTAGRDIVHQS